MTYNGLLLSTIKNEDCINYYKVRVMTLLITAKCINVSLVHHYLKMAIQVQQYLD